ncbi:unnamed protein product [Lactuca virosa]|uniref:Uncharacterized protein n=1 Tax=Lactuca virosa TaxID=75947 RepID=A0AAU9NRQ4_9ASTR|nr:unnamed protein product [Lactuca virosa]
MVSLLFTIKEKQTRLVDDKNNTLYSPFSHSKKFILNNYTRLEDMMDKGNFGAFVIGEKLYAIGGSMDDNKVLEIVECYKEGSGWEVCELE